MTKVPSVSTAPVEPEPAPSERIPRGRLRTEYHINRGLSFRLEQLEGRDAYAGKVKLQRKVTDGWQDVNAVALSLHPSCGQFETCRTLRAGGMAAPPAHVWPVKIGAKGTPHAECPCQACMTLASGEYRLVAFTCGGSQRLVGEPFWVAARH